jgi:molecular chaperone GrpE
MKEQDQAPAGPAEPEQGVVPGSDVPAEPEAPTSSSHEPSPGGPAGPSAPQSEPPATHPLQAALDAANGEHDGTKKRLAETEARLRAVSKAFTDLEADMDAFRRRMTTHAEQRVERKAAEVVEQFFEPVRNLRRSVAAAEADPASVIAGLKMIQEQFDNVLVRLGISEVPGVGTPFDPAMHEALLIRPVTDKTQDGVVLEVYAAGYKIGSKVLQPAQVVVGKFGEPAN